MEEFEGNLEQKLEDFQSIVATQQFKGTNYYIFESSTPSLITKKLYDVEKQYAVQQILLRAYRSAIEANNV